MKPILKKACALATLPLCAWSTAWADSAADTARFELSAETRQGINRDGEHALSALSLYSGVIWKPAESWHVRARARAQIETELEPSRFSRLSLDEAHLEHESEGCNLRMGVQQVVWGGADRLRVLDQIHPLDLRENFFGDAVQSRLPLAMFNTECTIGAQTLQWLVIPNTRHNRRPTSGSRFYMPQAVDRIGAAGLPVTVEPDPDAGRPKDWSLGLQWAGRFGSADFTLNAFHGWQGDPVYQLESEPAAPAYRASLHRFDMAGASMAMPLGPFVVKAEASVVPNASGYYLTPAGAVNATRSQEVRSLAGIDHQAANWFLSMQYYVQNNTADQTLLDPARQRLLTLGARRDFLQGRLNFSAHLAHDLENHAQWLSMMLKRDFGPRLQGSVVYDLFRGNPASVGRFHSESRLVFALRQKFF